MPAPRKTSSTTQAKRTNSRKRLSSQTEGDQNNSEDSKTSEEELQNQTPNSNDESPANSSSNSEDEDKVEKTDDEENDDHDDHDGEHDGATEPSQERHGGEPNGYIVRLGEEITFPATTHGSFAVVDQDVYREVQMRGSTRVSYQLVYTAGTSIPLSKLNKN